ncbi:MAG: hypothetical protein II364_00545, partial [Bacteroidales bacterium]|nr:hypothetical protein [Bacteroidales bacterium]
LEAAENAADRINAVMDVKANALAASATGNPVQIYPDEHSVIKPVLTLLPIQSGSGDPSPDNFLQFEIFASYKRNIVKRKPRKSFANRILLPTFVTDY